MPCSRPSTAETLRKSMYGAPRSLFALASGSERATSATSSRLWQTLRLASPSLIACPNLVPSPSLAGALTGSRQCSRMALFQRQVALPTFRGESHIFRAAVRFHDRLLALAVVALCLVGYAADSRPSTPGPSRTLFSRPLRSFKIFFWGAAPRAPGVYPGRVWAVSTRARVALIDRGASSPPRAGME